MKCPNKSHKVYQDLLKAFRVEYSSLSEDDIDLRVFEVWYKTQLPAFSRWYGNGNKDSFGEPVFDSTKNAYINDKGEEFSIFAFRNDPRFDTIHDAKRKKEASDKEIAEYQEVVDKMKDALTTKIAIYRNKGNEEHHKELVKLKDDIAGVSSKEAMALFCNNAIAEIGNSYEKLYLLDKEGKLNVKNLSTFRDYMSAYDILDTVRYVMSKNKDEFTTVDNSALSEAIKMKEEIKNIYNDKMIPLVAEALAPHSIFSTKEEIEQYLRNAPFDINAREMWLDPVADSKDAVLPLIAKLVDEAKQDTRKIHIGIKEELEELDNKLKKIKGDPTRVETLYGDMLERDINGKLTGYLVSEYRIGEFEKERKAFKDTLDGIKDKDSAEFKDAKKKYYDWLRTNTHQQYTPAYYEILNSLSEEARAARDVFNVAIREIMNKYKTKGGTYDVSDISDEDYNKLKEYRIGLARLKNLFYEDGSEKAGKDLAIAKELREFSEKISKVYERKSFDKKRFEAAQKKAQESGQEAYDEWKVKNVHLEFKEEFWKEFERITTALTTPFSKEINEKINSLLKEYKDENGIVNGEHIPKHIVDKIKQLVDEKALASKGAKDSDTFKLKEELNQLVKFVLTPYYHTVYDEMEAKGDEEFKEWFNQNHYYDEFSGGWRAIRIWNTMIPKNDNYILREAPNDNWYVTDVKDEYKNPHYKEDERGYALPVDKWKNRQFEKLLNGDKTILEYYNKYLGLQKDADQKLPEGYRLGYRLPGVRKNWLTRMMDNNGENAVAIVKENLKDKFIRRADDRDFGQLLNESGEAVNYIPIYFTGHIDAEERSFDLSNILSMYSYMALNHENLSKVIDTIEGAKHLIGERTVTQTSPKGLAKVNLLKGLINKEIRKSGKESNAYKQLEKFIEMVVYDQTNEDLGTIGNTNIDTAKLLNAISGYTAYSLLSLNFIAGTLNLAQGEVMNWTEANAGRFFTRRNYAWSALEYNKNTIEILADIGARVPKNKINFLNEWFDTLGKYEGETVNAQENSRFKRLMKSDTMFFLSNIGEHRMQSKVMMSMLRGITPLDKQGNKIEGLPTMYDAFVRKDGKWVLDDRVANFGEKEQKRFTRKVQGTIRRLHGNYAKTTAAMWQADARLRLVGAMRKWIRPGWLRRWESRRNNEFTEVVTEGMYMTTGRVLKKMIIDLKQMKYELLAADWKNLTPDERENIRRTFVEVGAFVIAVVAGNIFYNLAGGDDKDKRRNDSGMLYMAYIANRLQQELTFYINPISAVQILRSPAASMSVVENMLKLMNQLRHPTERYERTYREGELKLQKKFEDLLPFYKHIHHAFTSDGIEDQYSWLNAKTR